jgi:ribose-phosphate pyrophosphokinase
MTIKNSLLRSLITTDTIPLSQAGAACEKIKVLSVAPLLGEAIRRINQKDSVSSLFI